MSTAEFHLGSIPDCGWNWSKCCCGQPWSKKVNGRVDVTNFKRTDTYPTHCFKVSFEHKAVKLAQVRRWFRVQFQWERVRPKSDYLGWLKTYRMVKMAVKTLTKFANTLETLLLFFPLTLAYNFNFFKEIYMLVYKYAKILIENIYNFINEFRSCNIKAQWISDWLKP